MNRVTAILPAVIAVACSAPPDPVLSPAGAERPRSVSAPDAGTPASFFPADYEGELFVDFEAMRRTRLLDALERLPGADGFFAAMAESFGLEIDDVERVRTAVVYDGDGPRATSRTVSVVDVGDAAGGELAPAWTPVSLGGFDAWQRDDGRASRPTLARPRAGVVVLGGHDLLEPILDGTVRTGRAHPQLMTLTAGRGLVVQYAFGCFGRPVGAHLGSIGFPSAWLDADNHIEFVRIRLAEYERELVASLKLRYERSPDGATRAERELGALLASVAETPRLAVLERITSRIRSERDGRDLTISLNLGSPRSAIGEIERLALALVRLATERRDG